MSQVLRVGIRLVVRRDADMKQAFDVWYSDGNDRSCIGVLAVEYDPHAHEFDASELAWKALDLALAQYAKNPSEWEFPYMEACAVCDSHADDCECECHETDDECGECWITEGISVEECDDPETDGYHHARVKLEDL